MDIFNETNFVSNSLWAFVVVVVDARWLNNWKNSL